MQRRSETLSAFCQYTEKGRDWKVTRDQAGSCGLVPQRLYGLQQLVVIRKFRWFDAINIANDAGTIDQEYLALGITAFTQYAVQTSHPTMRIIIRHEGE